MAKDNMICVGIDIASRKFDVAFSHENTVETFDYNKKGMARFIKLLENKRAAGFHIQLICLEATGQYERPLVERLHLEGLPVAVVNPRFPRNYAKAFNKLAKTDAIDARTLAEYAKTVKPRQTPQKTALQQELADLATRRRQVSKTLASEKNKRHSATAAGVHKLALESITRVLAFLENELADLDARLLQLVRQDPETSRKLDLLVSVPGIAQVTAVTLLIELPELGRINHKQVARLAGLAPTNRDSGQMRGKRTIGGGRADVRTALYMPVVTGIRHNPVVAKHYGRLVAAGKPKKLAITATMRKLLSIINQMIRDQKEWKQPAIT